VAYNHSSIEKDEVLDLKTELCALKQKALQIEQRRMQEVT
jgi:hypothetical protein